MDAQSHDGPPPLNRRVGRTATALKAIVARMARPVHGLPDNAEHEMQRCEHQQEERDTACCATQEGRFQPAMWGWLSMLIADWNSRAPNERLVDGDTHRTRSAIEAGRVSSEKDR
jgi:hypothetical protein